MTGCAWCGEDSVNLVGHHYPIPKSEGGTETVDICPNCHARCHHGTIYIDARTAKTDEEIEKTKRSRIAELVKEDFPLLWERGEFYSPYTQRIIMLTPPWKWDVPEEMAEEIMRALESASQFLGGPNE